MRGVRAVLLSILVHGGACALLATVIARERGPTAAPPTAAPDVPPMEVVILAPEPPAESPTPTAETAAPRATAPGPTRRRQEPAITALPPGTAVDDEPRPITPAPRPTTPAPRPTTPAPRTTTPAPRPTTPAPRPTSPLRMRGEPTPPAANLRLDPHGPHGPDGPHRDDGEPAEPESPMTTGTSSMTFEKLDLNPFPEPKHKPGDFTTELQPAPGGGARIDDRVTTLAMEPDGNVKLEDKPDIDIEVKLPIPSLDVEQIRRDAGRVLTEWFRDPYASIKFTTKSEVARHLTAVPGACDQWGDVMCDDPLAPAQEKYAREQKRTNGSLLGGPMDITAWLHRKFIGDPYSSRKLKLLDETREERVARGTVFRGEQLSRSAELMTRTLEELWRVTGGPAERKQALFELWDDCAEGDGQAGEAGARARAIVIGWIRGRLPAGSAHAFTDEEIAGFNARRTSKEPFTPY